MIGYTVYPSSQNKVYSENEHSLWHDILNGDIRSDFVTQNALALSTLGVYHWQKGTDFL